MSNEHVQYSDVLEMTLFRINSIIIWVPFYGSIIMVHNNGKEYRGAYIYAVPLTILLTYVLHMNCCALSTVCRRPYHVEIRHLVQTGSGLIGEGNINKRETNRSRCLKVMTSLQNYSPSRLYRLTHIWNIIWLDFEQSQLLYKPEETT